MGSGPGLPPQPPLEPPLPPPPQQQQQQQQQQQAHQQAQQAHQQERQAQLQVLTGVHGTDKVYCLPAAGRATASVVFFVGDQLEAKALPPRVLELQDPKRQAAAMAAKFLGANVAVVMPSRLEACFACFDHFLGRVTATGEPLGHAGQSLKAVSQLASLLQDGGLWAPPPPRPPVPAFDATPASAQHSAAAGAVEDSGGGSGASVAAPGSETGGRGPASGSGKAAAAGAEAGRGPGGRALPVKLVGFSKGGTVLNQVLAELAAWAEARAVGAAGRLLTAGPPQLDPPPDVRALMAAIDEVHYLDVGLNCRGAYNTDPQVAKSLGASGARKPRIVLHGTPRQWDDPTRPWIGREAHHFEELLAAEGVPVTSRKYFADEPLSLEMHFEAIETMQVGSSGG